MCSTNIFGVFVYYVYLFKCLLKTHVENPLLSNPLLSSLSIIKQYLLMNWLIELGLACQLVHDGGVW